MGYGERPIVIHTRVVLAVIDQARHEYVVLTPDKDIYADVLHESNGDYARFFYSGPQGGIPRGVSARNVYAFAPTAPAELALHMQAGRALAEEALRNRGADQGAGIGNPEVAPDAAAEQAAAGRDTWVLHDCVKGRKIGEEVAVPADAPRMGDRALIRIADSEGNFVIAMAARMDRDVLLVYGTVTLRDLCLLDPSQVLHIATLRNFTDSMQVILVSAGLQRPVVKPNLNELLNRVPEASTTLTIGKVPHRHGSGILPSMLIIASRGLCNPTHGNPPFTEAPGAELQAWWRHSSALTDGARSEAHA